MKVLTLVQAVEEIRRLDPSSAVNITMLNRLINDKKIPYGSRGVRTVVEWYMLIASLNEMLNFTGETFLPKIRTVRNAAFELKESKSQIGVSEEHIRRCIEDGRIGFIAIGNRRYIAMQSFDPPYSETLVYGKSQSRTKRELVKKDILQQLNATITKSAIPQVKRKRE